jgi:hypothetical protein
VPQPLPDAVNDDSVARERSLAGDLHELIDEGRVLAETEFAFRKSQAAYVGQGARGVLLFTALTAMLVFCALLALTVGLVVALTPLLTPWGAAGGAFAGLLLTAFVCSRIAAWRWRRITDALSERETDR